MKIGIIGGGAAGLVSAWLLEQDHEVILFEAQNRLGGHAHTIQVEVGDVRVPIEIGFEFFNKRLYPTFCSILQSLNVPTKEYMLDYVFFTSDNRVMMHMPPFKGSTFFWRTFSAGSLAKLMQLGWAVHRGNKIFRTKNYVPTIKQYLDSLMVSESFKNDFFYPFFSTAWGSSIQDFKEFAAYDWLAWTIPNKSTSFSWNYVVGGMSVYIQALVNQLTRARIHMSTPVKQVAYVNGKYVVMSDSGIVDECDHIILATNAYEALHVIQEIAHVQPQKNALSMYEYLSATLAIHGDASFMPQDKKYWCHSNVLYTYEHSTLTIYDFWKTQTPIFRSWVMPGFHEPKPLYATEHFFHARPKEQYFKGQQMLAPLQGAHNMWFAGMYTNGIDSHESAIKSAVAIAKKLAPQSARLAGISNSPKSTESNT